MANSVFWKCAAVALIIATFFLARGLHQAGESHTPGWLATAAAEEPNKPLQPLQWNAVAGPDYMPQLSRARIDAGRLVVARSDYHKQFGLTFVPDPEHSWRTR